MYDLNESSMANKFSLKLMYNQGVNSRMIQNKEVEICKLDIHEVRTNADVDKFIKINLSQKYSVKKANRNG